MGLFGMSGSTWKKVGGYALKAAPYVAAPFTGGLSIPIGMALQGGIGAATGAMGGGGLKGALIGGGIGAGLGAIPGGSAATGVVKNLVKPALTIAGGTVASNLAKPPTSSPQSSPPGNVYSNTLPPPGMNNFSTPGALSLTGGPANTSLTAPPTPGGAPGSTTPGGTDAPALPPGVPPDDGSPDWKQKYGPLIAQAGGLAAGIFAGKAATASAQARSPEEQAALAGEQGSAGNLSKTGTSLIDESRPYISQPAGYYQKLLTGDRAAMAEATAAPRAQLREQGAGSQANLERSGIRGAARDVIGANINRDTASKVSALTTGVQPGAASALGSLGTDVLKTGAPMVGQAGNIYSNLLAQGNANRQYARTEGGKTGDAIGKLAAMAGTVPWGSTTKKKPAVPGAPGQTPDQAPTTYNPADYPTYGPPMPPPTFTDTGDYSTAENY